MRKYISALWSSIAQAIFLRNFVSDVFGQYWLDNILMQCCPSMVGTTLYRVFSSTKLSFIHAPKFHRQFPYAMLAQIDPDKIVDYFSVHVVCANIASVIFLCSVVSDVFGQHWLDCGLVGQHCAGNCFVQCWPNQNKTTLRRIFSCKNTSVRSGPNSTSNFPMHCCLRRILTLLSIWFPYAMLSQHNRSSIV